MAKDDETKARLTARKQAEWAKQDEADVNQAMAALLNTPIGRKLLWWQLQIGRVNTQPFNTDALIMAFNCGELNTGQQILARMLEVDPQGYVKMQQENADGHAVRTAELAAVLRDDPTGVADNESGDGGNTASTDVDRLASGE